MRKFLIALLMSLFVASTANAEIKTYTGTDEYIVGEHETHETAKKNSKIRAMRNAQDQAGVFIRSHSRTKDLELVDDEIVTLTEGILKVVGAPNHEIRLLGDGKGILIFTTIKVEIDTDDLDRRLAEIARVHGTNKIEPQAKIPPPAVDNIVLSNRKVEEALKLCDAGKFREAIPICKAAINLNSNNAKAYEILGWAHNGNNEFFKGIEACNKALELNPNSGVAYERLARAYIGLKKYAQAIFYCNKAIQIDPNYNWSYLRRAKGYAGLKNYRQAIDDYTKAIQLESKLAYSYWYRGKCYEALGEHDKARADFAKARQLGWKG